MNKGKKKEEYIFNSNCWKKIQTNKMHHFHTAKKRPESGRRWHHVVRALFFDR